MKFTFTEMIPSGWMIMSAVITALTVLLSFIYIARKQKTSASLITPTAAVAEPAEESESERDRIAGDGQVDANATKEEVRNASTEDNDSPECNVTACCSRKWSTDDPEVVSTVSVETMKERAERDPVEFCDHIQSEVKKTQQRLARRELEGGMTEEQRQREGETQREQLSAIYKLMGGERGDFGIESLREVQQQMRLYQ